MRKSRYLAQAGNCQILDAPFHSITLWWAMGLHDRQSALPMGPTTDSHHSHHEQAAGFGWPGSRVTDSSTRKLALPTPAPRSLPDSPSSRLKNQLKIATKKKKKLAGQTSIDTHPA